MNSTVLSDQKHSGLYNILARIPSAFFEKASVMMFLILMTWPAVFSFLYFYHYSSWIPLFSIAFWDTGVLALCILLLYIGKNIITTPGWLKAVLHSHLWCFIGLCFLLWILLSCILSKDWSIALNGSSNRCEGLLMYCFYGAFTGCAILIHSERFRRFLLCWFSLSSLSVCLCIFIQYMTSGSSNYAVGLSGPFLHFNHCGYYLAMASMCSGVLVFVLKRKMVRVLFGAVFCIDIAFLIINDTFGGYLAVLIGCISVLPLFWQLRPSKKGRIALAIPMALFIMVSVFMSTAFSSTSLGNNLVNDFSALGHDQMKLLSNADDIGTVGTGRMELWKKAVSYIGLRPFTGHGPEGLSPLYTADHMIQDRPANEFLYYAGCFGIPGLLLYLSMLITLFLKQWKHKKTCAPSVLAAACLVITYLCSSCFGNSVYYTTPYFFMFLGLCSHNKCR